MLGALLRGTVRALAAEVPGLGTTVAVDAKHIYAWVRENNPRERIPHRFDPARQPRGDPDCRLGAKRLANQGTAPGGRGPAKEDLWGSGTGIVSTADPVYGAAVLAEVPQPFNCQDVTDFHPADAPAVANLGTRPTNLAADAAFDAWHVYPVCAEHGGLAAIPRTPATSAARRRRAIRTATPAATGDGRWPRPPGSSTRTASGPSATAAPCSDPRGPGRPATTPSSPRGRGAPSTSKSEAGGGMRADLDRRGEPYRGLYRQRSSAERINSQAKALGIERPKVRNSGSVHRLNTLTCVAINARALQRVRTTKAAAASLC